jgi:hypothetical protein
MQAAETCRGPTLSLGHTKVKEVIDPKEDAGKVHLCPCPPPSPLQRNSIAAQSVRAALHAAKQLHAVAAVG